MNVKFLKNIIQLIKSSYYIKKITQTFNNILICYHINKVKLHFLFFRLSSISDFGFSLELLRHLDDLDVTSLCVTL